MYADTVTRSMKAAMDETNRRREIQDRYNKENGIIPKTIIKGIRDLIDLGTKPENESKVKAKTGRKTDRKPMSEKEKTALIERLTAEMKTAAKNLEFEQAAFLRDKIRELKGAK